MKKIITRIVFILIIFLGIYLIFTSFNLKENKNLNAYINTDLNSNIALVIKASNGEGLVALTNDEKIMDQIVINTIDGKSILIQVNELGQPTKLEFDKTLAIFSNYTESSVDISVAKPNKEIEIYKNSAIDKEIFSLIPTASAYSVSEYMSGVGTSLNVVSCGIGLGTILFSGGATSPLAYLGCASLATRIVTLNTEIGPCKGDILNCATEIISGSIISEIQKNGPDFLKDGFRLKGSLKNSVTGKPITNGIILIENLSTRKKGRGEVTADSYEIYLQDFGVYSARVVSEGFSDSEFDIILASDKAQIRFNGQKLALEKKFKEENYIEMKTDLIIDPDSFVIGEVIDAKEGDSIGGAAISLFVGEIVADTAETESDGMFTVQPPLYTAGKNFILRVVANGYKDKDIPLYISYDVEMESNKYIIDNWEGVVKLDPIIENNSIELEQVETSDFSGLWDGQIVSLRRDTRNDNDEFICDQKVFSFKVIKISDDKFVGLGDLGKSTFEKEVVKFNRFSWNLDGNGNLLKGASFPAEGNLIGNKGFGTWSRIMEDWTTPAHEKYEICGGTWTAEKIK